MKIFEYVQVNSQLLDTVQHKVRLSEQLEEMEVNIVDQIQDQVGGSRYLDNVYTIYISMYTGAGQAPPRHRLQLGLGHLGL